jgi:rhamnulokinase
MREVFAAVDVGVERGRVVVGRLDDAGVSLREVHRFANPTVRQDGTLRWNIRRLFGEILAGLSTAARAHPGLAGLAIDAWGMDFGLLDARGKLLGDPYHHRDCRTDGVSARLHGRVPEGELWAATGAQPTPTDTLHQLYTMGWRRSSTLRRAARLLLIPDLLASWLCGVVVAEHTIASTAGCYDPGTRTWAMPLLGRARIPVHLFPPVVPPATVLGSVSSARARRAGLAGVQVVAAAGHDSAAAVASVSPEPARLVCVGAGPWSLVGTLTAAPIRTEAAWKLGFTNAGAVDGAVWLHRRVAAPGGASQGSGIALELRRALRELEELLGRRLECVHLLGEGARDAPLCQRIADACVRPVLAGPVEAAALGNVLAQAIATGACGSWREARAIAARSFPPIRYEPRDPAARDELGARMEPAAQANLPASG